MKYLSILLPVLFVSHSAMAKTSKTTRNLTASTSHVLLAAGQCSKELGELMKSASFIGSVKSTEVTAKNGDHKTVTEKIEISSMTGGYPFSEPQTVAKLTMIGVIADSNLACDGANCTTYKCSIEKFN